MKNRSAMLWGGLMVALAVVVFVYRDQIHFDWATFWQQLRHINTGPCAGRNSC